MHTSVNVIIRAPLANVWSAITNIASAKEMVSAIAKIEILDSPADESLIGFRWRETRIMFGKEATEIMEITKCEENTFYETWAESHGAVYISRVSITEINEEDTQLSMSFSGTPKSRYAKIFSTLVGWAFKGSIQKALQKDLEDIKNYLEQSH